MLLITTVHCVQAQKNQKLEYKFGKILPQDFLINASGIDSASAIKLFDIGNCYFEISPISKSFVYVYERHIRYKTLTKLILNYQADIKLILYQKILQ